MRTLLLALVLVLLPSPSFSDEEEAVQKYLDGLRGSKTAAFYAECQLQMGKVFAGKAALVFPAGERRGLYIERNDRMRVVNTAIVTLENGKWDMEDAHGGLLTIKRVSSLAAELLGSPFQLVQPDKLMDVVPSKPKKVCAEKLPE